MAVAYLGNNQIGSSGAGGIQGITMNGSAVTVTDGVANLGTVITNVSGKEDTSNKITSISSSSTDTQYPSAKLLYDQLALKAPLASPAFTGTPTAPTASSGTNTTQVATTQFVQSAISANSCRVVYLDNDDKFDGNFANWVSGGCPTSVSGLYNTISGLMDNETYPIIATDTTDGEWYYFKPINDSRHRDSEIIFEEINYRENPVYRLFLESNDAISFVSASALEKTSNKVTSISSSSTNTEYPSAKCVYDLIGDVETLINAL